MNIFDDGGFDIAPGSSIALAALQPDFSTVSPLYSINLSTGAAG